MWDFCRFFQIQTNDLGLQENSWMQVSGALSEAKNSILPFAPGPSCSPHWFTHIVNAPASGSWNPQRGMKEEVVNFTWTRFGNALPSARMPSHTAKAQCLRKEEYLNMRINNQQPSKTLTLWPFSVLQVYVVKHLARFLFSPSAADRDLRHLELYCDILACKWSTCNGSPHWILMLSNYVFLLTVNLKSETRAMQQNALLKQFSPCSTVKHQTTLNW